MQEGESMSPKEKELRRAYAKFNERIKGRINFKGNFVPTQPKEFKNEKRRNLRTGFHRRPNVNPAIRATQELLRKTKANSIWGVRG
jgi:hypothetical protein